MKKRSMSTLSSASSTCGSFRYCGSVLPQCAIFCRRLMSAQLMSLTAFKTRDVFPQLLLRMMSAQLMSLTTSTSIDTIARKVHVIAETCQMTMNYVPFCDERGYSQHRRNTISMIKADLIETEKHGRLLKVLGNCEFHFRWYLNRLQFKPEGSYDVSIQMG